jgi:two-component system response regulator NreC
LEQRQQFEVVAEAASGNEALKLAQQCSPDLMLLDIGMPEMDGIQVTKALKASSPGITVLILTAHEDVALLREAIRAGAAGYVVKRAVDSELVGAMEAVLRGDLYVHPAVTRALLADSMPLSAQEGDSALDMLTPREQEVLALLAEGLTNQQVAEKLVLSVRTVESHRANIQDKLALRSRADLVKFAAEHGVLKRSRAK